jgi:hypothetical protein
MFRLAGCGAPVVLVSTPGLLVETKPRSRNPELQRYLRGIGLIFRAIEPCCSSNLPLNYSTSSAPLRPRPEPRHSHHIGCNRGRISYKSVTLCVLGTTFLPPSEPSRPEPRHVTFRPSIRLLFPFTPAPRVPTTPASLCPIHGAFCHEWASPRRPALEFPFSGATPYRFHRPFSQVAGFIAAAFHPGKRLCDKTSGGRATRNLL